jgi:hypothetical protein
MSLRPAPRDLLWLLLGCLLAWLAQRALDDAPRPEHAPRTGTDAARVLLDGLRLDLATLEGAGLALALGDSAGVDNLRRTASTFEGRRADLWERLHGDGASAGESRLAAFNIRCGELQRLEPLLRGLAERELPLRDSLAADLVEQDSLEVLGTDANLERLEELDARILGLARRNAEGRLRALALEDWRRALSDCRAALDSLASVLPPFQGN